MANCACHGIFITFSVTLAYGKSFLTAQSFVNGHSRFTAPALKSYSITQVHVI